MHLCADPGLDPGEGVEHESNGPLGVTGEDNLVGDRSVRLWVVPPARK